MTSLKLINFIIGTFFCLTNEINLAPLYINMNSIENTKRGHVEKLNYFFR
jgi:hypothetical protein